MIKYKKIGTTLDYYDATTTSASKKTNYVTVKNLDAGKKYLMRVVSMNEYGSEASEAMEVQLEQGREFAICVHASVVF